MRFNEEYKALLTKINVQKCHYAEREMAYSNELEQTIQLTVEKKQKWTARIMIYTIAAFIVAGLVADLLIIINQKWLIWFIIGLLILGFLVLTGFEVFYIIKLKKLNEQKQKEQEDKKDIRSIINDLNNQISTLVVSIITINEHFNELANMKSDEERLEKWNVYTKEVIAAINKRYKYVPTYSEYQEFYRDYEQHLEQLEDAYEK